MKTILAVTLFIFSSGANASQYDGTLSMFENGINVKKTYHQILKETNINDLSVASVTLHKSALAVFSNPDSAENKKSFLSNFPQSFSLFTKIFNPKDFGQLYDGFIYINLFQKLSNEYPVISVSIYLSLAGEACLTADAPNYLRNALLSFHNDHPDIYKENYSKLSLRKQKNIRQFRLASLHEGGNGTCNF